MRLNARHAGESDRKTWKIVSLIIGVTFSTICLTVLCLDHCWFHSRKYYIDSLAFTCLVPIAFPLYFYCQKQGWPNFLDRGPFSEIRTKARATPHHSIFSLSCRYVLWRFKENAKIDVRARKMWSLKFDTAENKKPKKMKSLEMMYDGCWIVLSCVWW